MKNKIGVYTCITGEYDGLKEIEEKERGIDYYCFTNNKNIKSDTWNVVYIEDSNLSNVELARKTKILGHPLLNEKYEILVWMDGNITFNKKIKDFIKTYLKPKDVFVAFKHGERDCVKEECNFCIRLRKEKKEKIQKVLDFYKKEKYMDNNGLIESTVYIKRPHDKLVKETMKLWFSMIVNYTTRDQLSFNYCIFKTGLKVKWINEKVFDNDWFDYENHNFSKKIESYRLYFGDQDNYQLDNDIQNNYLTRDNKYVISVKIPSTVDSVILEFSKVPCTILKNVHVKNHSNSVIEYYNYVDYKGKKVFYNKDAIIKINDSFEKGKNLTIELEMELMDSNRIFNFLERVCIKMLNQKGEIEILRSDKEKIQTERDLVVNSRGWRYLEKLRKIKHRK